jgi:hypothetical protein
VHTWHYGGLDISISDRFKKSKTLKNVCIIKLL